MNSPIILLFASFILLASMPSAYCAPTTESTLTTDETTVAASSTTEQSSITVENTSSAPTTVAAVSTESETSASTAEATSTAAAESTSAAAVSESSAASSVSDSASTVSDFASSVSESASTVSDSASDATEAVSDVSGSASPSAMTESVSGLTESVSGLTESVSGLTESVSGLSESVSGLTESVSSITESVSGLTGSVSEFTESGSGFSASLFVCGADAAGDCSTRCCLLEPNAANQTILTNGIGAAYDNFTDSEKASFNTYYNQIRDVVYNGSASCADKVDSLIQILPEWNANNAADQQQLDDAGLDGWGGDIQQFVGCGLYVEPVSDVTLPSEGVSLFSEAVSVVSESASAASESVSEVSGGFVSGVTESASVASESVTEVSGGDVSEFTVEPVSGSAFLCGAVTAADCSTRCCLLDVDAANSTILIADITDAYDNFTESDRASFNTYFNMIRATVYNSTASCEDKVNSLIQILPEWNANNAAKQQLLYSVGLSDWGGDIQEFVSCGVFVEPVTDVTQPSEAVSVVSEAVSTVSESESTAITETTAEASTPSLYICGSDTAADCSTRCCLIAVDTASNSSILTNDITAAYNTWSASNRASFNTYFNKIRTTVYNSTASCAQKLSKLVNVLPQWNENDTAARQKLYNITLDGWGGTIKQFVKCG